MKRSLWIFGILFALIVGLVGIFPVRAATISEATYGCTNFFVAGNSAGALITLQVSSNGVPGTPIAAGAFPVTGGSYSGDITFPAELPGTVLYYVALEDGVPFITRTSVCGSPATPGTQVSNMDGRLNGESALPPFILYCQSGGIAAWTVNTVRGAVYEGRGSLAFVAYGSQIANALALATASGQNVRITGNYGVSLYALSSYELQAHWEGQGNPYDYIFKPNRCGVNYVVGAPVIVVTQAAPSSPGYSYVKPPVPVYTGTGSGQTYVVQPGDNLYRIALRFGVPLWALAALNGISNYNYIYVGQVLRIP